PRTETGEDLLMPSALAADPRTGQLYVASFKHGDLFRLSDPDGDGKNIRYERFTRGLFQDVFGMLHDGDSLFVLHRRNLTQIRETTSPVAANFKRVASVHHAVGGTYDWAYGLVRDKKGHFLFTLAPHANQHQAGAGSLVRISAEGQKEIAFGFRNPLGWCVGPVEESF